MKTVGDLLGELEAFLLRLEENPSYAEVKAAAGKLRPVVSAILHPEIAEAEQAADTIVSDADNPPEPTPPAAS